MDTAFLPGKVRLPLNRSQAGKLSPPNEGCQERQQGGWCGSFLLCLSLTNASSGACPSGSWRQIGNSTMSTEWDRLPPWGMSVCFWPLLQNTRVCDKWQDNCPSAFLIQGSRMMCGEKGWPWAWWNPMKSRLSFYLRKPDRSLSPIYLQASTALCPLPRVPATL